MDSVDVAMDSMDPDFSNLKSWEDERLIVACDVQVLAALACDSKYFA